MSQSLFVLACLLCSCCPVAPAHSWLPICTAQYTILVELCLVKMLVWQNTVASRGYISADYKLALDCPIYSQGMNASRISVGHTSLMCCRQSACLAW